MGVLLPNNIALYDTKKTLQRRAKSYARVGWGTGTRTPINGSRNRCPTFRRSPNVELEYHFHTLKSNKWYN